jgi:thiamine-phosphate pyrophosphorylase
MLRCAITSRALYPGDELQQQAALIREASRWATHGIDLIQLREKDLPAANLATLARKILRAIAQTNRPTKLLINSRLDIAIATCAHGVHLTAGSDEFLPAQVRSLYASANLPQPVVTVSCHTPEDVRRAHQNKADAILFAPVFEKIVALEKIVAFEKIIAGDGVLPIRGQGLDQLHAACILASPIPVYALGGVTLDNASSCIAAGAAGIAGIRLFHRS